MKLYQTPALGFGLGATAGVIGDQIDGTVDQGAPKNIGEGYRWNTRDLYYAFDANFLTHFGSNGVTAIDQAFAVFNNLTNVLPRYSADLSEWPLEATRQNFQAQTLLMLDFESSIMEIMMEVKKAPPVRYAWVLHDRFLPGGATFVPTMAIGHPAQL